MSEVSPSPAPRAPASRPRGPAAGVLVGRKLRALDAELATALPRVLATSDEEAIHDLRVAIRRLRTLLKLARPIYGRFYADAVRAAFTVVHRSTGALRDEEVLDETLEALPCTSSAFLAWKERRRARERSLRRSVLRRLERGDLTRARRLLGALLTLPVRPNRDRPATKLARRSIDGARRGVERLRDTPIEDGVRLHELRIAFKELRYAAELLADALPSDLAAMAEPASRFQKRLGEIHDADMAMLALRRARGLDPASRAEVLAALTALRAKRTAKYLAEMSPGAATPEGAVLPTPSGPGPISMARARGPKAARPRVTTSGSSRSERSRAS
ncbi:MAG TPA: CHAD domain-containing protein [Polyangiaceae bacterium]|jgi:CHAD domain-containing protein